MLLSSWVKSVALAAFPFSPNILDANFQFEDQSSAACSERLQISRLVFDDRPNDGWVSVSNIGTKPAMPHGPARLTIEEIYGTKKQVLQFEFAPGVRWVQEQDDSVRGINFGAFKMRDPVVMRIIRSKESAEHDKLEIIIRSTEISGTPKFRRPGHTNGSGNGTTDAHLKVTGNKSVIAYLKDALLMLLAIVVIVHKWSDARAYESSSASRATSKQLSDQVETWSEVTAESQEVPSVRTDAPPSPATKAADSLGVSTPAPKITVSSAFPQSEVPSKQKKSNAPCPLAPVPEPQTMCEVAHDLCEVSAPSSDESEYEFI